ncbi:unnamed protein product [Dibothriocephalus latus]|uniref:Helix-turn-helix domain-containing protein n=1 Tax=Dibothriocephalus latus TaxID=60516 RepID=A0A3P7M6J0_DIBLA|nr:unnamed protein product [Dibothriocephalus latus]
MKQKHTHDTLALFYGLPKIHKPNVSLRPIVAHKGIPNYNLAKWMYRKLKFLQGNSTTLVQSASRFLEDLRGQTIQTDEIMVSFDVTSLFLHKRLEEAYEETRSPLKIKHIMRFFEFCQTTYFTFVGEAYEQIRGTPMDSPISDLVAELGLQELENTAFNQYKPVFWRRYVDDTFVTIEKSMLQNFHKLLNGIFPDIQFTREEEKEQRLPLLDVLVKITPKGEIETTVYRKATNTTQLSFQSNYPVVHKRSCVKTLFKRIHIHCNMPEEKVREARYPRDQFMRNSYLKVFINRCPLARPRRTQTEEPPRIWHALPYIKGVLEATERIAAG